MGLSPNNVIDDIDIMLKEVGAEELLERLKKMRDAYTKQTGIDEPSVYWGWYMALLDNFKLAWRFDKNGIKYAKQYQEAQIKLFDLKIDDWEW